jgi:hypothetical protein
MSNKPGQLPGNYDKTLSRSPMLNFVQTQKHHYCLNQILHFLPRPDKAQPLADHRHLLQTYAIVHLFKQKHPAKFSFK